MGDFNEIVDQSEKVGGVIRNAAQMESFKTTLSDCHLGDLGYRGSKFTWSNKRSSAEFVKERMDRALATAGSCGQYPDAVVEVLPTRSSDHRSLWIRFQPNHIQSPKLFRFEANWNVSEDCADVIKTVWNEEVVGSNSMAVTLNKRQKCETAISKWSLSKFGSISRSLKSLTKRLTKLQDREHPGSQDYINKLQKEIHQLLEMEDLHWRQWAKQNWYKRNDRNTQYFHAWENQRRRASFIGSVKDQEGVEWSTQEDIVHSFNLYFQSLFTSEEPIGIEDVISGVHSSVTPEMNAMLTRVFTTEKIDFALS